MKMFCLQLSLKMPSKNLMKYGKKDNSRQKDSVIFLRQFFSGFMRHKKFASFLESCFFCIVLHQGSVVGQSRNSSALDEAGMNTIVKFCTIIHVGPHFVWEVSTIVFIERYVCLNGRVWRCGGWSGPKIIKYYLQISFYKRESNSEYLASDFLLPFRWIGMAFSLMCTSPVLMTSQSICIMEKWFAGGFIESEIKWKLRLWQSTLMVLVWSLFTIDWHTNRWQEERHSRSSRFVSRGGW